MTHGYTFRESVKAFCYCVVRFAHSKLPLYYGPICIYTQRHVPLYTARARVIACENGKLRFMLTGYGCVCMCRFIQLLCWVSAGLPLDDGCSGGSFGTLKTKKQVPFLPLSR